MLRQIGTAITPVAAYSACKRFQPRVDKSVSAQTFLMLETLSALFAHNRPDPIGIMYSSFVIFQMVLLLETLAALPTLEWLQITVSLHMLGKFYWGVELFSADLADEQPVLDVGITEVVIQVVFGFKC